MSNVKRIYVEKKTDYAVKAKELLEEVKSYLGIDVEDTRVLVRYDIENLSDETYKKARRNRIFSASFSYDLILVLIHP